MLGAFKMIAGGAAGSSLRPQDVFATVLWNGNGGAVPINSGINMSGEGGLFWSKDRSGPFSPDGHYLVDTARGASSILVSNSTAAAQASGNFLTSFNSNGVTVSNTYSQSGQSNVGWFARKAPKFFDVVAYVGDGNPSRILNHNLGVRPGLIIIKAVSTTGTWIVYHITDSVFRYFSGASSAGLNSTAAQTGQFGALGSNNASTFEPGWASSDVYTSGVTYVAYLFAHDTSPEGLIQCGNYVGNGLSPGPAINLGWRPQFLMVKRTDGSSPWWMWDTARDPTSPHIAVLRANASDAENASSLNSLLFQTTGFQPEFGTTVVNADGGQYVYMAIREPII